MLSFVLDKAVPGWATIIRGLMVDSWLPGPIVDVGAHHASSDSDIERARTSAETRRVLLKRYDVDFRMILESSVHPEQFLATFHISYSPNQSWNPNETKG